MLFGATSDCLFLSLNALNVKRWQVDRDGGILLRILTCYLVYAALDPSVWPLLVVHKAFRATRVSWGGFLSLLEGKSSRSVKAHSGECFT
jgi:hypothetical protein